MDINHIYIRYESVDNMTARVFLIPLQCIIHHFASSICFISLIQTCHYHWHKNQTMQKARSHNQYNCVKKRVHHMRLNKHQR